MFFKSMELHGFKSFPDKTILHFDRKITAVIGSNGNGKSNISDALRWVMGEQGAKTLRGDKMEDVIFHGTVSRRSMGVAKVALTIDNTDRTLNVDSDEVVISRKLFRSGESEYLINGQKSRLKDINELFMGTGLGRDGYSIVGQGRVAEIVNAKPSGRREIFEEAAGVSKFLSKRQEALKQLANAEENVLRQMDIVSELESRLPPLKKQVEKAKAFIELDSKKKQLEVSVSVMEISKLNTLIAEAEDKILKNKAECDYIDKDISRIESNIENLSQEKLTLQSEIDRIRRENTSLQEKISDFKSEIAVLENDILHHERRTAEVLRQLEASKNGGKEYDDKIHLLQVEIQKKQIEAEDIQKKITEYEKDLLELNTISQSDDAEYKELDKTQSKLYIKLTESKVSASQAELQLKELKQKLISFENSSTENENKSKEYSTKLNSQKLILDDIKNQESDINNRFGGYELLINKKKSSLDKIKLELENNRKAFSMKKQRLQILKDVEQNLEGYFNSVKEILRTSRKGRISGVHGTFADIISVDSKYTVAIETALGSALQNIIVDDEEIAKRCIRHLKDTNAGRATFLPLTSVKGNVLNQAGIDLENGYEGIASELVSFDECYKGVVNYSLGRTVIVDDINTATFIAKKYNYKFRIITLDGQVVNSGGSFTGGSLQRSAGFFTRKQEIGELNKEVEVLEAQLVKSEKEYDRINSEYTKLSIESQGFKEQLSALKEKYIVANSEYEKLKILYEQCNASTADFEKRRENYLLQIKNNVQRLNDLNSEISLVQADIDANEQKLLKHDETISQNKIKRAELSDNISKLSIEKMSLQKDIENAEVKICEIQSVKKGLLSAQDELNNELVELKDKIYSITEKIVEIKKNSENAVAHMSNSDEVISKKFSQITDLEQEMTDMRASSRDVFASKEKFSKELARQEERKLNFQKEYDKIISLLWQNYEMTFSEARQIATDIDDLSTAQIELSELKKKISALGTVNLASIEEYNEVSQRYEFLTEQLNDIEKAKADLEKLISDLTSEIKTKFMNSFVEINKHFSAIFKEIFGGGTARLELSDPEDVLSSGIEIYAAPPGKLIKNLISLSGGEQTMVAATIYFAILRHRPAPFCMFDEVDAALDEANVMKYISYLRRFSGDTQLMIITHRRLTIEGCDVLYGVFMQEKGVSRLLKQDMSELESELIEIN